MPIDASGGVLCCGNISYDIPVWPVEEFRWGTTHWVKEIKDNVGGNGGNTAYAMAKLGARVRLVGVVGSDPHGDAALSMLARVNVDLGAVHRSPLPTNTSICVVHPNGERLFLHQVGASAHLTPELVDLAAARRDGFTHFHLANLFSVPAIRDAAGSILAQARDLGLTTSLDTGWDASGIWMEAVAPCLPHTGLFFVNETEAAMLTELDTPDEAAARFLELGAASVLVKAGGAGCVLFAGGVAARVAGFAVDVVDTTGAGDCFAGGLLAALHRGMPLAEACRFAVAAGALSVQNLGSVTGLLGFEETLAWVGMNGCVTGGIL